MANERACIIFPYFLDPRQGSRSQEVLLLSKLHLLLYEALTVQDSFLISRLLATTKHTKQARSIFCDWIERGWIKIALREGAYSLSDLRKQLYEKALNGKYIPFEEMDEGIQLYRSRQFMSYLQEIDKCLSTDGAVLPWDEQKLGIRLCDHMKASAKDGTSGLSKDRALSVWKAVDRKAFEGLHTRSMYYDYANTLSDHKEAQIIRAWVGAKYLTNLPDALCLGVSLPRTTLRVVGGQDPIQEIVNEESVVDPLTVKGRDCVLLSGKFLQALEVGDIERLRRLNEFKNLIKARSNGEPEAIRKHLLIYLTALGEEGPKIADPTIRRLEAQVHLKHFVGVATELMGVGITAVNPSLAAAALMIFGIFLKATSGTEKQLEEAHKVTDIDLQLQRTSIVDFCHEQVCETESSPNQPMQATRKTRA